MKTTWILDSTFMAEISISVSLCRLGVKNEGGVFSQRQSRFLGPLGPSHCSLAHLLRGAPLHYTCLLRLQARSLTSLTPLWDS